MIFVSSGHWQEKKTFNTELSSLKKGGKNFSISIICFALINLINFDYEIGQSTGSAIF